MIALYRYLFLFYFAACAVLVVSTLLWQQHNNRQLLQSQLQLYADVAQLVLAPKLEQAAPEQLQQQLAELQFSASMPVAALALYPLQGELLLAVGQQELVPVELLVTEYANVTLSQLSGRTVAIVPMQKPALPFEPFSSQPTYLLLIIPEPVVVDWWQLWPAGLAWLLLTILLMFARLFRVAFKHQQQQRLSLFKQQAGHLQLENAMPLLQCQDAAELDQAMLQFLQQQQKLEQQCQQLHSEQQRLIAQFAGQQQQIEQQRLYQQRRQECLARWLHQWQLLCQRKVQLAEPLFETLQQLHYYYASNQFTAVDLQPQLLSLPQWLASQLSELNALLPHDCAMDWLESADNYQLSPQLDPVLLKHVMQAMLLLALRSESARDFSFKLQVVANPEAKLSLQLACDGNGLPKHLTAQLHEQDSAALQWRDADIAVLKLVAKRLNAELHIESLEGLGVRISLQLPVSLTARDSVPLLEHLLVFDADPERLAERLQSLGHLALQVSSCNNLSDLRKRLQEQKLSALLVFLPGQAPCQEWLMVLAECRCPRFIFVPPLSLPLWRQNYSCYANAEFCLGWLAQQLAEQEAQPLKQLLVVDDNETNQAFIKVLLQHKGVKLTSALTGAEALTLCQQQQFDMVLLDIRLPDLPGTEVAQQLRRLPSYQQVPVLAFTAHALPAEMAAFRAAGMDDIVLKPLDPCKFESLLQHYQLC